MFKKICQQKLFLALPVLVFFSLCLLSYGKTAHASQGDTIPTSTPLYQSATPKGGNYYAWINNTSQYVGMEFVATSTRITDAALYFLGGNGTYFPFTGDFKVTICENPYLDYTSTDPCSGKTIVYQGTKTWGCDTAGWCNFNLTGTWNSDLIVGHDYGITFNNTTVNQWGTYGYSDYTSYYAIGVAGTSGYSMAFKMWNEIPPAGLTIETQVFDPTSKILTLTGHCSKYGTGINQLSYYADSYPDTNPLNTGLADCVTSTSSPSGAIYSLEYNGFYKVGTSTVYVDDSFFGTEIVSVTQNFSATSSVDWAPVSSFTSNDDNRTTAHNQACSSGDWATADPQIEVLSASISLPALNFVKLKCQIVEKTLIFAYGFSDMAKSAGLGAANTFTKIFPFNFAKAIKTSWDNSASATLPSGLAWIDSKDSNGNITIPIYSGLSGNSTTTMTIWGNGVFNTSTSTAERFTDVRTFTTYLFYALFVLWLYFLGERIYHDMSGHPQQE